jgi:RNA polymerase sigma-54 factor
MEPRLILEQTQKLIMTPELKQAITVLTLPALELTNYIQQQLEENPVLELPEGLVEPDLPPSEDGNIDLKELFADSSDLGLGAGVFREEKFFEPVVIQYSSLQDYLKFQLHIIKLTPKESRIGEFIIDSINREGYLTVSVEEIAEVIGESKSQINEILAIIKTFDPAGVGASNLSECLKLQLDPSDPRYDLLYRIVDRHRQSTGPVAYGFLNGIAHLFLQNLMF